MRIELYKSFLCPRCAYAAGILKKLQDEIEDLEVVTFDLLTDMQAFKDANIRMIPTLRIEEKKASWVIPKASQIKEFVLENC